MHGTLQNRVDEAREIGGRPCPNAPSADRIVRTIVGRICKIIWPDKTDAHVAAICGCDPRNARRYLSGELPIPAVLLAAINVELVKRFE
jgi:hypothetical protein